MSIGDSIVALQGQMPNPNPGQGGAPSSTGGNMSNSSMPAAQVYAPDPSVGQSIQMLMQMHEQDRRANGIDRGLAMMAGSFGPTATRGAIINSAQPQDDRIGAMGGAITDASALQQVQQQQRMMEALRSGTFGGAPGATPGAAPSAGAAPTPAPGALPAAGGPAPAAAAGSAPVAAGAGAPPLIDPNTQAILANMPISEVQDYIKKKLQSGIDVQQAGQENQAKDVEEGKNNAIEGFSAAHQKLSESEAGVNQLLGNMGATMSALSAPSLLTTNAAASWIPQPLGYSDAVKQQAIALEKLKAGLTGESLNSVKNVRNRMEFATLGEALTAGLNANNGQQGVQDALTAIQQRMAAAHANVYATAGKQIPNQYAGMADPSYTSPTINGARNPYYTGSSYEPPPQQGSSSGGKAPTSTTIQSPGDVAKLQSGTPFIVPSGPLKGQTRYAP